MLIYNGIPLRILRTNVVDREAIYDETQQDYLYTRWTIDVSCLYNSAATAAGPCLGVKANRPLLRAPGQVQRVAQPNPVQQPNAKIVNVNRNDLNLGAIGKGIGPWSMVETDVALRHFLMQPRKQLYLYFDSSLKNNANPTELLMLSPLKDKLMDATGGPKPLHCDIQRIGGNSTFFVHFVIRTDLNECGQVASCDPEQPVILSNKWTMAYDTDTQYFTSRIVDGIVHFRLDLLQEANILGDALRSEFNFPIPFGFKRELIRTMQSPDGTSIKYQFIDREVHRSLNVEVTGNDITHIEGHHQQAMLMRSSMGDSILSAFKSRLDWKAQRAMAHMGAPAAQPKK